MKNLSLIKALVCIVLLASVLLMSSCNGKNPTPSPDGDGNSSNDNIGNNDNSNNSGVNRLATPVVSYQEGAIIYWGIVDGADHYKVDINSSNPAITYNITTDKTYIDLSEYYGANKVLQIFITAISPVGGEIGNSAICEYFFNLPTSPISEYAGLGQTVNLLTGGYTTIASGTVSIFNETLFNRFRVKTNSYKDSYTKVVYSESLQGYANEISNKNTNKIGVDVSVDYMKIVKVTAGFDYEIGEEYKEKTQNETKSVFYDMDYYYTNERVEIEGYKDKNKFTDALSEEFLADALKVQNGEMTPAAFIDKYGTHVVTSGIYGGMFNLHYEMLSDSSTVENIFTQDTKTGISAGVGACIYGVNLGLDVNVENAASSSNFVSNTNSNVHTVFEARTYGGDATGKVCQSLSDFSALCEAWAATLDTTDDYVLIDVENGSLYFVWDYLPDEYQAAKDILNMYFKLSCDESYSALVNKISSIYSDSFIFNEIDGTLLIDISMLQDHENVNLNNISYTMNDGKELFNGNDGSGVFTIYRKFNGKNVNKVVFIGGYNVDDEGGVPYKGKFTPLTIVFDENWDRDIVIEFENFAFVAPTDSVAIDFSKTSSKNITIIATGTSYIKGGDGSGNGYAAINAEGKNIIFEGKGSIEILGGNGANGNDENKDGFHGGSAVQANSVLVNLIGDFVVYGGNGGKGIAGKNGGTNNKSLSESNPTGGSGQAGSIGGNGGDGACALLANFVNIESLGSGSKICGGNGGNGEAGGNGGVGQQGWKRTLTEEPRAGTGGVGGTGGIGGAGGNGGAAISGSAVIKAVCEIIGGNGGDGGAGGNGGNGGKGGDNSAWTGLFTGSDGGTGNGGRGGSAGNGGNGGNGGVAIVGELSEGSEATFTSGFGGNGGVAGEIGLGGDPGTPNNTCPGGGSRGTNGTPGTNGENGLTP